MPAKREKLQLHETIPNLEQQTFLSLLVTADAFTRELEDLFKAVQLSPTQYNVLRILRGAGEDGLACGQIIERMITRDPDLTRLLDRMENRHFITRSRDTADRRIVLARISAEGLSMLATLDQPVLELHRRQLGHISQSQLHQLLHLLELARKRDGHSGGQGSVSCDGKQKT